VFVEGYSVSTSTIISFTRVERKTITQLGTGLELERTLLFLPLALPDDFHVITCILDVLEQSERSSINVTMENLLLLIVDIALQGMDMILMIAFLAGMKETAEEFVYRVGVTIVAIDFLHVSFP
jgi:hypothetical protein